MIQVGWLAGTQDSFLLKLCIRASNYHHFSCKTSSSVQAIPFILRQLFIRTDFLEGGGLIENIRLEFIWDNFIKTNTSYFIETNRLNAVCLLTPSPRSHGFIPCNGCLSAVSPCREIPACSTLIQKAQHTLIYSCCSCRAIWTITTPEHSKNMCHIFFSHKKWQRKIHMQNCIWTLRIYFVFLQDIKIGSSYHSK